MASIIARLTALFFHRSTATDIKVQTVAHLNFKAGDTIVISHPGMLSRMQCALLRAQVLAAMPGSVRVLVLCGGVTLQVIDGASTAEPEQEHIRQL